MSLIEQPGLAIRLMRDELLDYQLMSKWLTDERVLAFYGGRDNPFELDMVVAKYSPRVLSEEKVVPCILEHDDTPIGYLQYYPVKEMEESGPQAGGPVFGIDLFIGEPDLWVCGIGTRALRMLASTCSSICPRRESS